MLLELKQVFLNEGEKKSISYEFSLSELEIGGVFPFKTPIKVEAVAENRASLVDLRIHVSFGYTRNCDRCFDEFTNQINYNFTHRLVTSLVGDSDDDYIETPDYTLELDQLIMTDILLELPSKNLCKEECKGLCQKCGQNLNLGNCNCDKRIVDPRLEILKQLID